MRFRYKAAVVIHFIILLFAVSQGRGESLPCVDSRLSIEESTRPKEGTGIFAVRQSMETLTPKQEEGGRPPKRGLSSEIENVLLLLIGIILFLIIAATKLWLSKDDRESAKTN